MEHMNIKKNMIEYVKDRPGHDLRYSTDITKIKNELNWSPRFNIDIGISKTIAWYTKLYSA